MNITSGLMKQFAILFLMMLPGILLKKCKLVGDGVALTALILAATPSATSATMFAEKYNCDAPYTSRLVIVSTLLSIFTMPLIVWIFQSI